MTALLAIGQELLSGVLLLKNNSQNDFSIYVWDDVAHTLPSNLAATTFTIEVDQPTASGTIWSGTVVGSTNQVTFSITQAQSTVSWDKADFRIVYVNSAKRYVILSGEVRVQR